MKENDNNNFLLEDDDEDIFALDDETTGTQEAADEQDCDDDEDADFEEDDDTEDTDKGDNDEPEKPGANVRPVNNGKKDKKTRKTPEYGFAGTKAVIKEYLDDLAAKDPAFARCYANPKKSLDECCSYICSWAYDKARSGGFNACAAIQSDEVFGQAVHYYQEINVSIMPPSGGFAIAAEGHDLLSDEEKAQLNKEAEEKAREDYVKEEATKRLKDIRDGKVKVDFEEDVQKAVTEEARKNLVKAEEERLKKNQAKRVAKAAEKQSKEEANLLF